MRILIADDETTFRRELQSTLQELGHEVIAAADGREALTMARQRHPQLAILDIMMPFTDGLEAALALSRTQPLPILILTAFGEKGLIDRASALPIHGYLIKPVKSEQLQAAIAVAVKRFEETQALRSRAEELEETLETRKLIDRAKGRLMAAGMSEERAFRHIQDRARRTRITMREVAQSILDERR